MNIPDEIKVKLSRLKYLYETTRESDHIDDEMYDSLRVLQKELVNEFLPILREITNAGLLSACFLDDKEVENDEVAWDVEMVGENGNICLFIGEPNTWMKRNQ